MILLTLVESQPMEQYRYRLGCQSSVLENDVEERIPQRPLPRGETQRPTTSLLKWVYARFNAQWANYLLIMKGHQSSMDSYKPPQEDGKIAFGKNISFQSFSPPVLAPPFSL